MIAPFRLHRPKTIEAASTLLSQIGGEAAAYCGGTELLQVMKMGLASFTDLIDLKGIEELYGITIGADGSMRIGAAATHREIERSPVVAKALPTLIDLEHKLANVRVRNTGSLGGNLCFAEPHSDPATLLIAAGAELELSNARRRRRIPLEDFILAPLTTAREEDEVLVAVWVPPQPPGSTFAYLKVAFHERPAAAVGIKLIIDHSVVANATIVVGSVGDRPVRVAAAEDVFAGVPISEFDQAVSAAAEVASDTCEVYPDLNGSEEYKRHLVNVLTQRAARAALRVNA